MPGPAQCNKIQDPKERKKCLAYKGKYAKKAKGAPKNEMSRVRGAGY